MLVQRRDNGAPPGCRKNRPPQRESEELYQSAKSLACYLLTVIVDDLSSTLDSTIFINRSLPFHQPVLESA
jgi:hypothetical protein